MKASTMLLVLVTAPQASLPDSVSSRHLLSPIKSNSFFIPLDVLIGMAVARDMLGKKNHVISVIGDGAMTAGQAYEAMNNSGYLNSNLIVVLNDNRQVSLPTATLDGPATPVGALSKALTRLQASTKFRKLREAAKVRTQKSS